MDNKCLLLHPSGGFSEISGMTQKNKNENGGCIRPRSDPNNYSEMYQPMRSSCCLQLCVAHIVAGFLSPFALALAPADLLLIVKSIIYRVKTIKLVLEEGKEIYSISRG